MKKHMIWAAGTALSLALPTAASAEGIEGLWRFDIINSAGTTLGAMTIQSRDTVQRQADEQQRWAEAKGRGEAPAQATGQSPATGQSGKSGYTGFAMTGLGGHALPIESIHIRDGAMVMVVNSPRGLVIFRGTIDKTESRFDGKLTYHNGHVYGMRGVKQVQPL